MQAVEILFFLCFFCFLHYKFENCSIELLNHGISQSVVVKLYKGNAYTYTHHRLHRVQVYTLNSTLHTALQVVHCKVSICICIASYSYSNPSTPLIHLSYRIPYTIIRFTISKLNLQSSKCIPRLLFYLSLSSLPMLLLRQLLLQYQRPSQQALQGRVGGKMFWMLV